MAIRNKTRNKILSIIFSVIIISLYLALVGEGIYLLLTLIPQTRMFSNQTFWISLLIEILIGLVAMKFLGKERWIISISIASLYFVGFKLISIFNLILPAIVALGVLFLLFTFFAIIFLLSKTLREKYFPRPTDLER